jgi:hypothetical protein
MTAPRTVRRCAATLAHSAVLLFLCATPLRATWLEPLFMPGEVAQKHAEIERQCTKCHLPFDKDAQDGLCLACHTEVATDLAARRGFHGRRAGLADQRCQSCHSEHRGRTKPLAPLDRERFDHAETDMPLRGAHPGTPCERCHAAGRRFRDAASDCGICHAVDDPHAAALGGQCDLCHEEKAWSAVRFDHDAARFPLVGRHREAPCAACHATRRFRPLASDCRSCHAGDDRHRGGLGTACQSCHSPRDWKFPFDHARRTDFPLLGKHAAVDCEGCHRPDTAPADTPTACHSCHAVDDAHAGRFGSRCESCHSPLAWPRTSFDHARDTRFPLRGRHQKTDCLACHRTPVGARPLSTDCYSCHRERDVHRGREGTRCRNCHDERGWSRGVLFDHDTTRFPLAGAHLRTSCVKCHRAADFRDVPGDCLSCHEREDVHRGERGPRCERCHDASSWRVTHEPPR